MAADSFFETADGTWFRPTDLCRGPWDPDGCHAGPPAGLVARAMEALLPDKRLTRLTVDLLRPVPMAGFAVQASLGREGRMVSTSSAVVTDATGKERLRAHGLHLAVRDVGQLPSAPPPTPPLAEATPGPFVMEVPATDRPPGFAAAVEIAYAPGSAPQPGANTIWMRSVPLLPDEEPSPFQRICPLADSGNAIGRNAEPWEVAFVNPDLTLVLHRDPVGEWLGSRVSSTWEPDGIGLADALLFDADGAVGRACQTLLLTPLR